MLDTKKLRNLGVKGDGFPDPDVYFEVVDGKVDIKAVRAFFNEATKIAEEAATEMDELRELTTYLFAANKEVTSTLDEVRKHFIGMSEEVRAAAADQSNLLSSAADTTKLKNTIEKAGKNPLGLSAPNLRVAKQVAPNIAIEHDGTIRISSPEAIQNIIGKKPQ